MGVLNFVCVCVFFVFLFFGSHVPTFLLVSSSFGYSTTDEVAVIRGPFISLNSTVFHSCT